jgi:RNA polymerase sigma factor (sigma-70 family)
MAICSTEVAMRERRCGESGGAFEEVPQFATGQIGKREPPQVDSVTFPTSAGHGRFETWMFHIARNARADYFRRRAAIELNDEGIDAATNAPGPAHMVERDEQTALLRRALLQLREDRRELIILTRYRGIKHEAIAELLGVDAGTVKVRIHRALKELREIFLRLAGDRSWTAKTPRHTLRII